MTHQEDPRFRGKAIPIRNLIVVGGASMLFPLAHWRSRRWRRYPWAWDAVYLSIFWLDMAGNSFDLYDRFFNFDLVPHLHGTGALAVVLQGTLGLSPLNSLGLANGIHGLLEAQEYATDVLFGTHNVRGWWDTAGDLAAGLLGTGLYILGYGWFRHAGRPGRASARGLVP